MEQEMKKEMEPKKKNDKKTTLFVIGGLVILLSATAFFVFRTPKSQAYRETRVVSMETTPAQTQQTSTPEPIVVDETEEFVEPNTQVADTAYMTVTVPGFSTEDLKKKKAEDNDKKKTKKTTTTTTKTTTTYSKTKSTGQPAIVDHYYVDKDGNQVDNPNNESSTVYKIEYDKSNPLAEDKASDMISDYLKGDTTYVAENAKAEEEAAAATNNTGSTTNATPTTSITDDTLVVMGAQGGGVTTNNNNSGSTNKSSSGGSDDMIILQGEAVPTDNLGSVDVGSGTEEEPEEPEEEKEDVIMELIGGGVTSDERPSTVRVVTDGFVIDPSTQEWGEYGIQTDWDLPDNDGHDGTIVVGLYGLGAEYVKSLDFQCAILAGTGTIQNTEDDFVKLVHVDDGSAIQLVVTATYVDDSTKTSQIITVAHKDYSPLNSNQLMVEE
jgi:flagellar basal body-associated protein FliL